MGLLLGSNGLPFIAGGLPFILGASALEEYPLLAWEDVGHSGSLTDYDGSLTISAADTTLEDYRFPSQITQGTGADNLTIRNSYFDVNGWNYAFNNSYTSNPSTDLLIEDCTFEGARSAAAILGGTGTKTFRRCRFRFNKSDHLKFKGAGDILFESCHFGPLSRANQSGEDIHADVVQADMSSGGTARMLGCTWDAAPSLGGGNTLQLIDPDSWLYSDAVSAGATPGSDQYAQATIGYFTFAECAGVHTIESCHMLKLPNNGLQPVGGTSVLYVKNTKFHPAGVYNLTAGGDIIDQGGNQWAATGDDLQGNARTAGQAIVFS